MMATLIVSFGLRCARARAGSIVSPTVAAADFDRNARRFIVMAAPLARRIVALIQEGSCVAGVTDRGGRRRKVGCGVSCHFFSVAVQFTTTVMGGTIVSVPTFTRNRCPSRLGT